MHNEYCSVGLRLLLECLDGRNELWLLRAQVLILGDLLRLQKRVFFLRVVVVLVELEAPATEVFVANFARLARDAYFSENTLFCIMQYNAVSCHSPRVWRKLLFELLL